MNLTFKRFGLAIFAFALAGCATRSEPPRLASRPPPLSRALATGLAATANESSLAARASAFESYMRRAHGIDPAFSSPSDVAQALQTAASHEPHDLEAGMVAYAALAALQEPRFVAAVRAERSDLVRRISQDPGAALMLPGGEAAGARASGALYAEGSALFGEGEKVKRAAYSVQHQAWSRAKVSDPAGRLSRVKRLSAEAYRPSREDVAQLQISLASSPRRPGAPSPIVARGVALAALSLLGETGNAQSLMSEPQTSSCLRLAKLNLYQCLASAGPHYEDIYCMGQHAMIDPGQCVVEAARAPAARQMAMTKANYRRERGTSPAGVR